MQNIRLVALDVYGTILATDDPDNVLPFRKGFPAFAQRCLKNGVKIVTISDASVTLVKIDLRDSGIPLSAFDDFFKMDPGKPKDISPILEKYQLSPQEVAVFGDKKEIDIDPAKNLGCKTVLVAEYTRATSDTFDWSEVDLGKI